MKILVPVKRVIDPYVKIRVKPDGSGVQTEQVKMAMNPFDEIALEEAIRLRESGVASEVIIVSIGADSCQETLRHGLALGANQAILIQTQETFCSLNIAKILEKVVKLQSIQLVLMGKQTIDGDNNQTPQMLAGLLDWPQATYASKITLTDNLLEVVREVDEGLETIKLELPAVVSVDLRLNTPRYATLPNIMQAKNKPLAFMPLAQLDLQLSPHVKVLKVTPPGAKTPGVILKSVDELIEKLRNEAKLL
jgi:electron transfer flavoprotein beta subunit